jgi:hypothetical protein
LLRLLLARSFEPLPGAGMKLPALLALVAILSILVMVTLLVCGQNVLKLQTMECNMKDGWTIEEYLEYVKHLLKQAEEDGYTVG